MRSRYFPVVLDRFSDPAVSLFQGMQGLAERTQSHRKVLKLRLHHKHMQVSVFSRADHCPVPASHAQGDGGLSTTASAGGTRIPHRVIR